MPIKKCILLFLVLICVSGCGNTGNTSSKGSLERKYEFMSVQQVQRDLINNPLSASKKYSGKKFEAVGYITQIDASTGAIAVQSKVDYALEDADMMFKFLVCVPTDSKSKSLISSLSIGNGVDVQGEVIEVNNDSVIMSIDEITKVTIKDW